MRHPKSPLQKVPENPNILDTRFLLFRRNIEFAKPQVLYYNDNAISLEASKFNYTQKLKVLIHGYMGKWHRMGNLNITNAYLKLVSMKIYIQNETRIWFNHFELIGCVLTKRGFGRFNDAE